MAEVVIKEVCEEHGLKALNVSNTFLKYYDRYAEISKKNHDVIFYYLDTKIVLMCKGRASLCRNDVKRINKYILKTLIFEPECIICYDKIDGKVLCCSQCGCNVCPDCVVKIKQCPQCRAHTNPIK